MRHHFDGVFGWAEDLAQSFVRCGEPARRAVAIDDGDANAHTALAIYELFSGRHEEARRRLGRVLDLNPNSVFARLSRRELCVRRRLRSHIRKCR